MTFYLSHLLVHYQFSYQIAFHLVLSQGKPARKNGLLHCRACSRQGGDVRSILLDAFPGGSRITSFCGKYSLWIESQSLPRRCAGYILCTKCWFLSSGFSSFSSNSSPKRIWNWATLLFILQSLQTQKAGERFRLPYRGAEGTCVKKNKNKRTKKKHMSLYLEANWIFLIWWLCSVSKRCVLLWGHRGGLVNYQGFTGRKTEASYNLFCLRRERTVRFLCCPGRRWPQCWGEILPSTGQDHMCHINYVPNALPRYPCVSKGLMHLWVNDFFPRLLQVPEGKRNLNRPKINTVSLLGLPIHRHCHKFLWLLSWEFKRPIVLARFI